jgi:hypothetical protein
MDNGRLLEKAESEMRTERQGEKTFSRIKNHMIKAKGQNHGTLLWLTNHLLKVQGKQKVWKPYPHPEATSLIKHGMLPDFFSTRLSRLLSPVRLAGFHTK